MVLVMGPRIAPRRLEMRNDIAFGKNREAFDELRCQLPPARTNERSVKFAVPDRNLAEVARSCPVEPLECLFDQLAVLVRCDARGIASGVGLDLQTQVVNVVELIGRHRADDVAAVRLTGEEPILLEPCERFTQGNFADAELACERVLPDRRVLGQLAGDDLLAHNLENLIGKGSNYDAHGDGIP